MPQVFSLSKLQNNTASITPSSSPSQNSSLFYQLFGKHGNTRRIVLGVLFICMIVMFFFQIRFLISRSIPNTTTTLSTSNHHDMEQKPQKDTGKLVLQPPSNRPKVKQEPLPRQEQPQKPGRMNNNNNYIDDSLPSDQYNTIATNPLEIKLESYGDFVTDDERHSVLSELQEKGMAYLGVVMPTIPRTRAAKQGVLVDYFTPTLESYDAELKKNNFLSRLVAMFIANMRPNEQNDLYEKAKNTYSQKKYASQKNVWNFVNIDTNSKVYRPRDGVSAISASTVRQTSDFIHLIRNVHKKSKYLLIVEDDFLVCELTLTTLIHIIHKANARFGKDGWAAIRVSSGLNGIIMRNDNNDISTFADHLERRIGKRPPDHIFAEFCARETPESLAHFGNRFMVAYKYNLLSHLGRISTLRDNAHYDMPQCWETLVHPVSFEVEAFNPAQCPKDDLWPCVEYPERIKSKTAPEIPINNINDQFPALRPMKFKSDNNNPQGLS
ncbi:hypothetical protein C9374_013847 [Naegleria lovaniensis]|uniref:Uncharacterized protein n=1 Tax=Naegleria lovaniensis TaxID=51637 RepID=A0AA88GUU4_NAELO|nr:uncharacterized protein C9374_013847 [Naegleria lovaniensis]KAG2389287.1 hypothetical protein C9374_013847 [Naegleria lovaniensis]